MNTLEQSLSAESSPDHHQQPLLESALSDATLQKALQLTANTPDAPNRIDRRTFFKGVAVLLVGSLTLRGEPPNPAERREKDAQELAMLRQRFFAERADVVTGSKIKDMNVKRTWMSFVEYVEKMRHMAVADEAVTNSQDRKITLQVTLSGGKIGQRSMVLETDKKGKLQSGLETSHLIGQNLLDFPSVDDKPEQYQQFNATDKAQSDAFFSLDNNTEAVYLETGRQDLAEVFNSQEHQQLRQELAEFLARYNLFFMPGGVYTAPTPEQLKRIKIANVRTYSQTQVNQKKWPENFLRQEKQTRIKQGHYISIDSTVSFQTRDGVMLSLEVPITVQLPITDSPKEEIAKVELFFAATTSDVPGDIENWFDPENTTRVWYQQASSEVSVREIAENEADQHHPGISHYEEVTDAKGDTIADTSALDKMLENLLTAATVTRKK